MWIWIFIGGLVLGGCFGALVMGVFCGAGVGECKPRANEMLNETNEILDDMPWTDGNLPTGHRTTHE